jgi:capsular polysaccharide biosynthesis protein
MTGQALDLRRSARIVRRHKRLVGVVALLGLLTGALFTLLQPPAYSSSALIASPPSVNMATQRVIVTSPPVLSLALPGIGQGMSLDTLRGRVQTKRVSFELISVNAQAGTREAAIRIANAVARSYVAYVTSSSNPVGPQPAELFQPATLATGSTLVIGVLQTAVPAGLLGALLGAVIALAVGRYDRHLHKRDEIADSIGIPVLASVLVRRPSSAADWAKLLEDYRPGPADAWRLRTVVGQLGTFGRRLADSAAGRGSSVAVLSLSGDHEAVALGPQLAAFTASLGIPTALVVGPQQDPDATAALRAACAAAPERPRQAGNLHVFVSDDGDASKLPAGVLSVIVAVIDGQAPRAANTMRATMTLLGVASGAVTAQQLARVAASAAGDGRDIAGILVANPDPDDQTTGRLPQLARPGQPRMPTRITGAVTEIRQ